MRNNKQYKVFNWKKICPNDSSDRLEEFLNNGWQIERVDSTGGDEMVYVLFKKINTSSKKTNNPSRTA